MGKLEKFQSEIGKRILRLSKYHNNLAPLIGLHLPSIKVRVLLRKLSFLAKLLERNDQSISARVLRTLSVDNMYDISLIDQSHALTLSQPAGVACGIMLWTMGRREQNCSKSTFHRSVNPYSQTDTVIFVRTVYQQTNALLTISANVTFHIARRTLFQY